MPPAMAQSGKAKLRLVMSLSEDTSYYRGFALLNDQARRGHARSTFTARADCRSHFALRHDGVVMTNPDVLIAEFGEAAAKAGIVGWPCPLRFEILPAPHEKPVLPPGEAAVYVFAVSAAYGRSARCGPGTVLKVGRVGPNNKRRFRHSHYVADAPAISTLAQSLLAHPVLWPWLGIQHLDVSGVESWMLTNLDRTHFFIPGDRPQACAALEVYIRARVGSVFEGASIGSKRTAVPDES